MGRYAEVGPAAEEFLKRYAEDDLAADVLYFQGIAAQETGRHDAAAAALDRAVTAVAGRRDWIYFEDACVRLAAALEKTGKLREAAASYRQLAAGKDADTAARLLLQAAEWLQKAGDTDGAAAEFAKVFNQAKAGTGERRIAALRLARLEIGREQPAQAEKVLVQYLGDAPQAERGDAMLLLGYAQSRQARYPEAVATFRAFLDTPQPARLAAEGRYMLALTHLEAGQDDEAFALLTGLWQLPAETRPVFSRPVLLRLQEVAFQRNQYAVSEQIGRHLMESGTGEDAWQARLRLAETLMALNRHDEAAALLDETVDPTASRATPPPEPLVQDAWALLGEIALGKGERGRAYHAFEKSLARPGTSARTTVRGRWGKAKVLSDEGRAADALRHAVSAFVVGDDPVYTPRAMLLAIELLAGQGRLDEARATWEELGRRYPAVAEQNRGQPFVLRLTSPAMP